MVACSVAVRLLVGSTGRRVSLGVRLGEAGVVDIPVGSSIVGLDVVSNVEVSSFVVMSAGGLCWVLWICLRSIRG